MERYIPTGNEYISLPTLRSDGGIESLGFLTMRYKGMVELRGEAGAPLFRPFVSRGGRELMLTELHWEREQYWIPRLRAKAGELGFTMTVLAPIGERGFGIRMELEGEAADVRFGLRGTWAGAFHCVNEEKPLEGNRYVYESLWNAGFILDMRCGFPLFALAPIADRAVKSEYSRRGETIDFSVSADGAEKTLTIWWGLGFEEVAAATAAKEMLRRGWEWEHEKTLRYLSARSLTLDTPKATELYNTNLFFCLFYSTGRTLDSEELVCATSRSPRYYVSAAYWDRDTLLWAFPAILDADAALAREMLDYAFTRQGRNFGVHSRYIDGTVLEPGFELDELAAPVLALAAYVRKTHDRGILEERHIRDGLRRILRTLESVRHPAGLYETFLQPTDDERVYPYITYDNVLVWRAFSELAALLPEEYGALAEEAERVRRAIWESCVFSDAAGKAYFAWSVDLRGKHDIYDEPPGSLQLLPYYGFCSFSDEAWRNTVAMIRSPDYAYSFADAPIAEIGCPHAPHPWVLSLANSLLCGYEKKARRELEGLIMDNGIACESVDEYSGECTTGAAFATCAGFLCHALRRAFEEDRHAE